MINSRFRIRARLLEQLGEQLIKNESIALIELVKNSYDADASTVIIKMENIDEPEKGKIIVEDDGCGMNADIIKNVWLEPGTDFKKKVIERKELTPVFKRLPLGEKGIGRFAVHKLGNKIEIISRKVGEKEIYLSLDWNEVSNYEYIDEIPVNIQERTPVYFTDNKHGTQIIITRLKNIWNCENIKEIYRSIIAFTNPFDLISNFKIEFHVSETYRSCIKDLIDPHSIKDFALYRVNAEIESNRIVKFKYEFAPYPSMEKLNKRVVTHKDENIKKILTLVDRKNQEINLDQYKIGKIKFTAYIYDRETKILRLGLSDIRGLKEYLDINGGVRIYRDGIRIYDYGEPENDWLELDIRRVNAPHRKISNNLILAAIELDREKSQDLIEKTNREGFIENDAYFTFKSAILYLLNVIENQRNIDKEKIRLFYGTKEKTQSVIASIQELKSVIEEKIKEENTKREIIRYLNRIEKEYETINEILLKSAGAGLNLSVVIHEIEKILGELKNIIQKEKVNERIIVLVKHLSNLVEGYTALIRSRGYKIEDILKVIDQAVFNMEYRLNYHKITLEKAYKKYNGNKNIKIVRNLILNSIMNIIDNAIWWLDYSKEKEEKKLFINLIDKPAGYISIVIADNGCGFALPEEEIIKPFVSAKPDGMGLGLHIVSEVVKAHNGLLIFPENDNYKDYDIPDEYKSGAKIIISLKQS